MKPLIPMLAITGKPQIENITQMFQAYQKVGIDAVMLYPRSGLEIEYMSEEWRQFCYEVICVAKEIGMKIWLYDEYNWPSGSCKNAVAKEDPAYAAKRFVYNKGTVCVDVMKAGDAERVFDPFDSDMLNPDAIQCFIRLTHEKYYKWFGEYFGNVIPGIFTDEPSFIYTSNSDGMYPYYEGVEEDYLAACGRNLREDIIAFEEGRESPCFPGVFRRLISKKFKECYIVPIAKWCQEHNLLLTGHALEDARPLLGTEVTGNWFEFMDEFDVPGIDEILTKFWDRHDMLFGMIENLRYNGKKAAMAELFALGPCSMSFARRRQMLWYAAAHGINHYFIAISHLDGQTSIQLFNTKGELQKMGEFINSAKTAQDSDKLFMFRMVDVGAITSIKITFPGEIKYYAGNKVVLVDEDTLEIKATEVQASSLVRYKAEINESGEEVIEDEILSGEPINAMLGYVVYEQSISPGAIAGSIIGVVVTLGGLLLLIRFLILKGRRESVGDISKEKTSVFQELTIGTSSVFHGKTWKNIVKSRWMYLIILPAFVLVGIFCYLPMFGVLIAFKDYNLLEGFGGSEWIGLRGIFWWKTL